jgi:hypothetical protein
MQPDAGDMIVVVGSFVDAGMVIELNHLDL